jgi:uncharacterized cupin superfamily protein
MSERTRFDNVINLATVPVEHWGDESGLIGADSQEVALAVGAVDLGYCVVSLAPGKRSCPFHFHHGEEEVFHVLSGRGILRQGDDAGEEEVELGPGDFAAFPPGTGIAHQLFNRGDEPFVYLALSNRIKNDVAEYPDSDKILFRGTRMMLRRNPTLSYFDGETPVHDASAPTQ